MTRAIRGDLGMTLLTEISALLDEQELMHGAVGVVTQAAVFCDRIMFPQVGAAFFRVTIITGVVQAQLFE